MPDKNGKIKFGRLTKTSLVIWFICLIAVFSIIGYVVGIRNELFDQTPNILALTLAGFFVFGCLSFLFLIISISILILRNAKKTNKPFPLYIPKLLLVLAILPIYLIITIVKSFKSRKLITNIITLLFTLFIFFPIWIGGYFFIGIIVKHGLGYSKIPISISGTGSMYPTFPKGEGNDPEELAKQLVGTPEMRPYPGGIVIKGQRYFGYQIGRGDVVLVENEKIREIGESKYGRPSGWVKRIIGLSGDTIELREGIVYLNQNPLEEPYVARPRSTFGQEFLKECQEITVPEEFVFVMGDNRKGSMDSREIGFIEISSISHVIPLEKQVGNLDKNWRDTSKDFEETAKISLDKDEYLSFLNEKRREAGVKELEYEPKLEISAAKRGEIMLEYNDFSFEATESGYTMRMAVNEANYYNTFWGEVPTLGYFESEELFSNQFEFPETIKFLLDRRFQHIGIAEVEGDLNGCPTQVIVQHFGGYIPPNYKKEDIEAWKNLLSALIEIQPSWAALKENERFYQENKRDIDRINEIISIRINNISAIVARMEANQWFTDTEKTWAEQDVNLFHEQEEIANRLNEKFSY